MRVVVLGGAGEIGRQTVMHLARGNVFTEIVVADQRFDAAQRTADEIGGSKVIPIQVDIDDAEGLDRLLKEATVCINQVGPYHRFGTRVISAALRAGTHYVDIMDEYEPTLAALNLDESLRQAGITALINFGISPGMTNLLSRWGADQMDAVDTVSIGWVASITFGSRAVFAHRLQMFDGEVPIFRAGRPDRTTAFTEVEPLHLPQLGINPKVWICGHPESVTLARTLHKGVRQVTVKGGYWPERVNDVIRFCVSHGFTSRQPVHVRGVPITPYEFMAELLASEQGPWIMAVPNDLQPFMAAIVRVEGSQAGRPAKRVYRYVDLNRDTATAALPAIGAQMIAAGEIALRGVVTPEMLNPEPFVQAMRQRQVVIEECTE